MAHPADNLGPQPDASIAPTDTQAAPSPDDSAAEPADGDFVTAEEAGVEAQVEETLDEVQDLANQLDAMIDATVEADLNPEPTTEPEEDTLGDFVIEAELNGPVESPPGSVAEAHDQANHEDEPDEALGDFVSEAELNESATAEPEPSAAEAPQAPAQDDEFQGDFVSEPEVHAPIDLPLEAAAPEAVDEEADNAEAPDDKVAGDFLSEAELLEQVDAQLDAAADEMIQEEKDGSEFGALASMLGVDAEELDAIPPTETPEADPSSDDVLDDLEGAFSSVDDLLTEINPASSSVEVEDTDEAEFAGDFAAPDELDADGEELEGWFEPPAEAEDDKPVVMSEPTDPPAATPQPEPAVAPPETAPEPEPVAQTPQEPAPTFAEKIKPHVQRGKTAAVRLRPHLATLAKLSFKGGKAGCYYANWPVDFVAGKLAKEDGAAPPLKQYVGMVAAAVLIPGTLLLLIGLLG